MTTRPFPAETLSMLLAAAALLSPLARAADAAPESASDLAGRIRAKEQGTSYIRVKMETAGTPESVLQIQIKSRVSPEGTDLVYQILFPKERKGESVLLRRSGSRISGTKYTVAGGASTIGLESLNDSLFGTALSYADVIDNGFSWPEQSLVGTEVINRVDCQILESKPAGAQRSAYASVRTWVDPGRLVPLRIEKRAKDGSVIRRIEITRVLKEGDESIPIDLTVTPSSGAVTRVSGASIKRGVTYDDAVFTPEGLSTLTPPR